jgi:hypothetical protein
MIRSWRIALVLVLAAVGSGLACKTINAAKTKAPDPGTNEGDWAAVRNASTRRAVLYDEFQQRALITVTYLSPAVREARTSRLGEWLGWTPQELADHLKAEAAEAARYDDFVAALFTADRKTNDLDSRSSVWRMAILLDDGGEVVTREATSLDADATVRNLFPYVSPFDEIYRIRFNRVPGGPLADRPFKLVIASAMGRLEMSYNDGAVGPDRPEGSLLQ